MSLDNRSKEEEVISGRPAHLRRLKPWAWVITIAGFVFAVGPDAEIGNTFFGNSNNRKTWLFGMPSIWLWQVMWWLLGVAIIWFLAYKMQLSAMPEKEIIALLDDVGDRK
jgi:SSS family solute:Na+ symporter